VPGRHGSCPITEAGKSIVVASNRTQDEVRIAESYLRVLDDVSHCAQAVRDGDWDRLAKTAEELARRAAHLAVAASEPRDAATRPRAEAVIDTVTSRYGSDLAQALHPVPVAGIARTAMNDPFTHPDTQQRR
jgi:hypothetical protein